jgi:hypothetical protein
MSFLPDRTLLTNLKVPTVGAVPVFQNPNQISNSRSTTTGRSSCSNQSVTAESRPYGRTQPILYPNLQYA